MPGMAAAGEAKRERLGRNVVTLAGVSLLTDVASEMSYPLLPIFLTTVLGASATALGAIEGVAESIASLLKLVSGRLSDRLAGRKLLVVIGYGLASLVKPLLGLTRTPGQVMAIRVTDRVGKGIRTSPRDALIADSVAPSIRGRAFGFHRAADNLGAVIGPLIAFALLRYGRGIDLRRVFLLTAIPAALSVALLVFGLREVPRPSDQGREGSTRSARPQRSRALRTSSGLGARFWWLFAILIVFTLGNSSDAFLLLRATRLGVAPALVPVLWALLNLVKALGNVPGGVLSDRFGRRPLLIAGWAIYAAVYLGFGLAGAAWQVWALFAVYGLYFGATEGVETALVADFVPADRRGTAFGFYNLALGIAALPASLIFGELVDHAGARVAFLFGASMALAATVGICFVAPPGRPRGEAPAAE
ncbi:MAG TPA: MFS transporter [Thermoanaerobaculia bacterium]|nr:MFS transporter [Thermoanaerobaculia bacterium]